MAILADVRPEQNPSGARGQHRRPRNVGTYALGVALALGAVASYVAASWLLAQVHVPTRVMGVIVVGLVAAAVSGSCIGMAVRTFWLAARRGR